jgi:predicted transcriptional regulator
LEGLTVALKLSTFNIANAIVSIEDGRPTIAFHRWINDTVKTIQSTVNDLSQFVADIAFSIEQSGIAIKTANEAKAAAEAAADAGAAAAAAGVLVNSYVVEANVLSSSIDANKTTATITVANHTRRYGDGSEVPVTGGTIGALAVSTQYYVSYLDPERDGGTVLYETTTNPSEAGQNGDRHLVGGYMTPTATGTGSGGGTTRPPGVPSWKFPEEVSSE